MKRLLREPLVHFLLGGAALFLLYGGMAGSGAGGADRPDRRDRIVVSEARVSMLARSFQRTWMRPPTPEELRVLVDDYVTEEVLYREALALGLDRDDLVVRRRMRQKMEFLNEGLSESQPSEEGLRAFLAAHRDPFVTPGRVSFVQVFLRPDGAGAVDERAAELLARLRAGEDPEGLGDPTFLPGRLDAATAAQVTGTFGTPLADALAEVPVGAWTGPLPSSFGSHLVRVSAREPGRLPPLETVRAAVEREWREEQRQEAQERFHRALRARYQVEVHMPAASRAADVAARP